MSDLVKSNDTYTPKNDVIFKELFSRKGNEKYLIELLSKLTNENITSIEIRKDVTLDRSYISEKYGVLDIYATVNDSYIIDIEMQIVEYANFIARLEYYASNIISQQLGSGEDYEEIKKSYIIAIVDYDMLKYDEEYIHRTVEVIENHREDVFSDYITKIIVELPKFRRKKVDINNVLEQWLLFIDQTNREGVKMAMKKNENINNANKELEYLTGDEEVRRRAELRLKYKRDMNSVKLLGHQQGYELGKQEGIELGKQEGIELEKIKIIKSLLKNGVDIETIIKSTDLTKEELERIKNKL